MYSTVCTDMVKNQHLIDILYHMYVLCICCVCVCTMDVYCVFVIVSDYIALVIKLTIALHACTYTHAPKREWTVL